MYKEQDIMENRQRMKRETILLLCLFLPLAAAAVVLFLRRMKYPSILCAVAAFFILIFLDGMRISPLRAYSRYLKELFEGTSHKTNGFLLSYGEEEVLTDGVVFHELFINIYRDKAEDGVRRFLLDAAKEWPRYPEDTIVTVESHGTYVLSLREKEEAHEE